MQKQYFSLFMIMINHHLWLPVSATAMILPSGDKATAFDNGWDTTVMLVTMMTMLTTMSMFNTMVKGITINVLIEMTDYETRKNLGALKLLHGSLLFTFDHLVLIFTSLFLGF